MVHRMVIYCYSLTAVFKPNRYGSVTGIVCCKHVLVIGCHYYDLLVIKTMYIQLNMSHHFTSSGSHFIYQGLIAHQKKITDQL